MKVYQGDRHYTFILISSVFFYVVKHPRQRIGYFSNLQERNSNRASQSRPDDSRMTADTVPSLLATI